MRVLALGVGVAFVVGACSKAAEPAEEVAPAPAVEAVAAPAAEVAAEVAAPAVEVVAEVVAPAPVAAPAEPVAGEKSGMDLYKEARALHNSNRPEALRLYEQAAAKGHAASWKQIGSLRIIEDPQAAIAAYKKYVELMPEAPDAGVVREMITKLGGTP